MCFKNITLLFLWLARKNWFVYNCQKRHILMFFNWFHIEWVGIENIFVFAIVVLWVFVFSSFWGKRPIGLCTYNTKTTPSTFIPSMCSSFYYLFAFYFQQHFLQLRWIVLSPNIYFIAVSSVQPPTRPTFHPWSNHFYKSSVHSYV